MASAGIPSTLEPSGLSRSDGKRPDGLTSVPWTHGRSLVWDVTVPDTLAPSYRPIAVTKTGGVAARAESQKEIKYHQLALSYLFSPIAIESLGAVGPKSWNFLMDLGRRIKMYSSENKAFSYLIQRLSVAIQQGNATLVRGTLPSLTVDLFSYFLLLLFVFFLFFFLFTSASLVFVSLFLHLSVTSFIILFHLFINY